MKTLALGVVLLLSAGCASAPRPGPTLEGIAVRTTVRPKPAARREALESLLPLFLNDAARRRYSTLLEDAVFAKPAAFIGYEKIPKKGDGLVEVRLELLSAALQKAGLIRPRGYAAGPEVVLIAFGDRAVGPSTVERFAADVFETALFGRGIQAQDIDDDLIQLKTSIKAKTEAETVAAAAAGGWAWLAAGKIGGAAQPEPQSGSWRAKAHMSIALYAAGAAEPDRFDAEGTALDVSSSAAISHAFEQSAQDAAVRVEGVMARGRAGHATLTVMVSGYKDPALLRRVIADVRRTPGVESAALVSWHGQDEMAVIHAYTPTLTVEILAAKLINSDPGLRIIGIETADARVTVEGPDIPESSDRGQGEGGE